MKKKIYSWKVSDYIVDRLPIEIIRAMNETGWNVFGIYELVKESLKLEKENKITNR